jgi:AraC family transcriptional regulator
MGQIPALWAEFAPSLEEGMVAYGIVRSLPNGKGIEYAAAAEGVEEKEGFVLLRIPAQRYAVFVHEGRVSTLCETIDHAFQSWLPQSGYVHAGGVDLLERYGPEFDPTHGEGDLQVWIPVRDPEG